MPLRPLDPVQGLTPATDAAPTQVVLAFDDNRHASVLFGQYGQNLALIERRLGVVAEQRGNHVTLEGSRDAVERALRYMDLTPGTPLVEVRIDKVFIGSCTNARIEDLRTAAQVVAGRRVADGVQAIVVPGSAQIKHQAEQEGLREIFESAGFEWRLAGCSMCLGMNPDVLAAGERCASTSNRNFEGRQGAGGRTHLVSPAMAAAAAVSGHFTDVRELT